MSTPLGAKMKTMKWLIKREFWEHKGGFFWAPIVVGALMAVFIAVTTLIIALKSDEAKLQINGKALGRLLSALTDEHRTSLIATLTSGMHLNTVSPLLVVLTFVVFFFCLNALFDERKDRSVLFWKSLPVTDSAVVLSKVTAALVLAPIITFGVGIVTAFVIVVLLCANAANMGVNVFADVLSSPKLYLSIFQAAAMIPIYMLWALPTVGWLLMVGAWAKTKPFLWAVGVPLLTGGLIVWLDKMFSFGWNVDWIWQHIIGRGLLSIVPGSWFGYSEENMSFLSRMRIYETESQMSQSWYQLTTANLWIGVALGVAMIYAAIRIRRWKDDG